jgi:3-hydroxyacyl-CoA dehydrogenase/enoyl-CoA hydratase/3-hydroxybutyryl-CoA epimerase
MHYFSPVPDIPLLEVVAAEGASTEAIATAIQLGLAQGKTVIRVADRPGFYVNRILTPYIDEGIKLLHEGASIEDVDAAIAALGFPYGPLRLLDEVGIDIAADVNDSMRELMKGRGRELARGADALLSAGWTGKKGGKGFYTYENGERAGPNTDVYPFFGGDERRTVAKRDIQERCLLAIVNEAAAALDEGVIESPTDGDVGAVFGFGFPAYLGGPFWYLDRETPAAVADRLDALGREHGERFTPARSLRERAEPYHAE